MFHRVLITGANGMLGQELVRQMGRKPEYDVLATGRDAAPRFSGGSCGYTHLDIADPAAVERLFADFAPDVVINCAAMTQVDACESDRDTCWQINAVAVETLAACCRQHGARLMQISTDFIFDGKDGPYREDARPAPLSYYGRSKLAGENYARGAGTDRWAIIRTVLVFGNTSDTRSHFVSWVNRELSAGRTIRVVTDQWRTPTWTVDLADAVERVVRFRKSGVYHVSGRDFMSVNEFAHVIAETAGLDTTLIQPADSSSFSQPAERPARSGFIILKAETELGFRPHPIRDAVRATLGRALSDPDSDRPASDPAPPGSPAED
ncbi:MAG: dTDP-4-dehydrorhamnose reductase [Bacteroidetes bacterium]|nr:dTDP-4-dehydrorhamnose reductase [Bacteroidota bacterium]MDA0875547.1 dTDP-4-dehydrorhamnose reductase [Bacteroidota bacterium]